MEAKNQFEGCITRGPWGNLCNGDEWVYKPEGFISKILIKYRDFVVDSIEFKHSSGKGEIQSSSYGEPSNSSLTQTICIDCPDEYIVSISGTYGTINLSEVVVRSICFKTNRKLYGPYGSNAGTVFSHAVKGEMIIGFHGRASAYLNAIGIYAMPKAPASGLNPTCKGRIMNELTSSLPIMTMPRVAGPWGESRGKPWDDGVFSTIKQVRVYLGGLNVIYALQFEYLKKDGKSVLSQIHGGTDGTKIELVDLDGDDEFLMGISGFFGPVEGYNGLNALASITFHTNKRVHGPYGEENSAGYIYFSSAASPAKVVGFQGRHNRFLSAIGVHMEYF